MGCYSEIGVIILLYFVVFVLNIVKTSKQMNCFGVLQRFQAACTSQPNVPREISAEELAIYNDWIEEYPAKPKSIQPITR